MSADVVSVLSRVEYLAPLDRPSLEALARAGTVERYTDGERLVSELDFGADLFVVLSGTAEVSVEPRRGETQVLGRLEVGGALGEMASVSGELRSATVTAKGPVEVLRIPDAVFDDLRARRPEVAVVLVRMLAQRLADAEKAADELFVPRTEAPPHAAAKEPGRRGSIVRAWRELVAGRGKDLAFLALVAFVATLIAVRLVVFASFRFDVAPREVLRFAYVGGFLLLMLSACASLLTFRPELRRLIALLYGVACALIINELGVTLAFDIFFKDIHTADPNVAFDVERLYRRAEPLRFTLIALAVLVQLAYLRPFYRRVGFVLMTRLRRR